MQHCRARYCTCNVAAISISFILWGCGCREQPIGGGSALWHLWGSVVFYARRRGRAEEERTTSTGGVCGFSGPQSRLGLVRANPPHLPQFRIQIKKCLQLCGGWVVSQDCLPVWAYRCLAFSSSAPRRCHSKMMNGSALQTWVNVFFKCYRINKWKKKLNFFFTSVYLRIKIRCNQKDIVLHINRFGGNLHDLMVVWWWTHC